MRLRAYPRSLRDDNDDSGVMLVEPDDPEELVPLGAGELGAIAGAAAGASLDPLAVGVCAGPEVASLDAHCMDGEALARALVGANLDSLIQEWNLAFRHQHGELLTQGTVTLPSTAASLPWTFVKVEP